jgi:methionine-rich copper-binding protein CopC
MPPLDLDVRRHLPHSLGHAPPGAAQAARRDTMLARWLHRSAPVTLGLALLLAASPAAFAHAILIEASPAARSTVSGPDLEVRLRFNSRIDAPRSHLTLMGPARQSRALILERQTAPEMLSAKAAGLSPGAYKLRWQVLAADGHITRGEVPFQVK